MADSGALSYKTLPAAQQYLLRYAQMLETLLLKRMERLFPEATHKISTVLLPLREEAIADALDTTIDAAMRRARGDTRKEAYEEFYDALFGEPEVRQQVIEMQAKLQEIASIARKHSTVHILKAEQGEYGSSADDISFTLTHFRKQQVDAKDVQRYMDELAATFSLTSHPTNSTSLAHTKAAIALENVLSDTSSSIDMIIEAMDAFITAPVAAPRKTPIEELQEILPICDNLFDASLLQRQAILTALQISGYADEGVTICEPMLQVEDWSATFDGDGNQNATRAAMQEGVALKREWIAGRYRTMLQQCADSFAEDGQDEWVRQSLINIMDRLQAHHYRDGAVLMQDIEAVQDNYMARDGVRITLLDDLMYQVSVFGLYGSKGNVRHDANSLQNTLKIVMQVAGVAASDAVASLSNDQFSDMLTGWFSDPSHATLHQLTDTFHHHMEEIAVLSGADDTPVRILERLAYLATEPDIANKLIIAEATHPADAKAAMALLHITGSEVANPKAAQEIVMLVESVPDVLALRQSITSLAHDPIFAKHLQAMGRITVMIAHSDNRRRDGYSAGEVITRAQGKVARLQRELWEQAIASDADALLAMSDDFGVPIYIFDGGGNDLMRGAAVNPGQMGKQHGHAASRENAPTIRNPQNTIQGEQTRLLFGYPQCAAMFLEMMVSQTMYAKAAVESRIGVVVQDASEAEDMAHKVMTPKYQQAQNEAQRSALVFHDAARKAFHKYTDPREGRVNPFDNLFTQSGAWITTLLANRSSRSNQRGEQQSSKVSTVQDIRGNKTALSQRAITGNLLFQLTGTFHLGLLGQLEAFEAIGAEAAHQMFHSSLPDRTHIVGAAQQLQMTDFDKAWRMMGKTHPKKSRIAELAKEFRDTADAEVASPEATLAFMEHYGTELARKIFQAATAMDADEYFAKSKRPFTIRDAYRTLLPVLARQLDIRHARHEPENAALAHLERIYNANPDIEVMPMLEDTSVALVGALAHDIRPALGPLAVRGAKGIATTREEKALSAGEAVQPDIRDSLHDLQSGVTSAWMMGGDALKNLTIADNIFAALQDQGVECSRQILAA